MSIKKKKLLTIREAAALIDGLSEYRIRCMCKNGELPHFKSGNRVLITEENLMSAVFGEQSFSTKKDTPQICNLAL